MAKRVGVILSGCGVYDGSEIHEAVFTLYYLDKAGVEIVCMAPNRDQTHVVNHLTGQVVEGERRNILVESARIARGNIRDISTVSAAELDAVVMPGGYGAAKNLCDFAFKGANCEVLPEVERLIWDMHSQGKPVVAICIAPAVAVKALAQKGVHPKVTIGTDSETAAALEAIGAKHENRTVTEVTLDLENKVITTPAYMLAQRISEVAEGIENTINQLIQMLK
ncbi:MAG: isoprenoid biosynthesis glyoxalase ElbB [bacterium]